MINKTIKTTVRHLTEMRDFDEDDKRAEASHRASICQPRNKKYRGIWLLNNKYVRRVNGHGIARCAVRINKNIAVRVRNNFFVSELVSLLR